MRDCVRKVHWLQALAAATIIVWSAPSRSSAAKSTAYDTDIVEPLEASGRLTFSADASDEQASRNANRIGLAMSRGSEHRQHHGARGQHRADEQPSLRWGGPSHHSGWGKPNASR